jgi:hypothetical protein
MTFLPFITIAVIFGAVFLIRKAQNQGETKDLENLRSTNPGDENNFTSPANRKFQNINHAGAKITWIFNEDASQVQVKGGMFGLNTINSTIKIESLGYGKYKGSNGSIFTVEGNRIKSGHIYLNEIFE